MTTAASPPQASETPAAGHGFHLRIGLFDATMLVMGSMIGSGIFLLPATMTRDVGSAGWLLLAWVLTGLITMGGALSYAELAAMMPRVGGQYVYLREAYNPLMAFLYGWTLFLVIQTGFIAAVAVAFARFLGALVPQLGTSVEAGAWPLHPAVPLGWRIELALPGMTDSLTFFKMEYFQITAGHLVSMAVIAFLSLLNCRGVEEGKWVQNLFTVAKTGALVLLIVLGLAWAASPAVIEANTQTGIPEQAAAMVGTLGTPLGQGPLVTVTNLDPAMLWQDPWQGITGTSTYGDVLKVVPQGGLLAILMVVGATMVYSLFASDTWNNVTFTAGETRNPRRNLPSSLVLGTGLVTLLYLAANVTYLSTLTLPQIAYAPDGRVATEVMRLISPRIAVPLMAVAIMISTFGCDNGLILAGARLYYAMAKDGLFFRSVGRLNRRGVPAAGLILQGMWACLLLFTGSYEELSEYAVFAALIFYFLTVLGLFILRFKLPGAERPYRAFGYPVVPALYLVAVTFIMLDLLLIKPAYSWAGLIIVLTGIPIYFVWRWTARGSR
jgi:APA family basic amino acid/polyamine antiporter